MEKTLRFRKQHEEIVELAKKISALLNEETLKKEAKTCRSLLAKMAGILNMHLVAEDNVLYPRLLQDENNQIKSMAQKYMVEMSGLKEVFADYMKNWPSSITIEKKPSQFITDTARIFAALNQRIEKENNELYYIVDRLA